MNGEADIEQQLRAELDSGENIVWEAQGKATALSAKSIVPSFFGVIWLGIIVSMMFANHGRNMRAPPVGALFPFIIVGVVFIILPLARFFSGRKTYYLITNRRALIITLGRTKKVLSYSPAKLQSLERRERPDGTGDIVFERSMGSNPWGGISRGSSYLQEIGFMNIPDVKNVEGMLRDLGRKV